MRQLLDGRRDVGLLASRRALAAVEPVPVVASNNDELEVLREEEARDLADERRLRAQCNNGHEHLGVQRVS